MDLKMDETARIKKIRCLRVVSSGVIFCPISPQNVKPDKAFRLNQILLRLIEDEIEFSVRTQNCLNAADIKLIGQLVQKTESELLALKSFGKRSLNEIKASLAEIGLGLETPLDFPPWSGDNEDKMLIQILSLQRAGGGFDGENGLSKSIGSDIKQIRLKGSTLNPGRERYNPKLSYTAYVIDRLEAEFERGRPYLTDLIQRHKRWIQKEMKR